MDQTLKQEVALKTPLPNQPDKGFRTSAKISAMVNHHNVAKTYDYFEDRGTRYLVEEFIQGEDLSKRIKRQKIVDPQLGAHILHSLAKGMAASHLAGVVHRDLKPSNVIVSDDLSCNVLKITDFGIASFAGEVIADVIEKNKGDLTLTHSGTVKGALPYMSPEMMFRKRGDIIPPASDVWSLGAMMYHILTGNFPFGVGLRVPVNVDKAHLESWPSFMTDNLQFSSLSIELQSIIRNCTQRDPSARPSAKEIVLACQALCYAAPNRREATYSNPHPRNQNIGFICDNSNVNIMYHADSVYGPNKPNSDDCSNLCINSYAGSPYPRAHPVTVMKPS